MTTQTKSNETLENCKAILQIELNNLKKAFGDIKNKYHLEPKIQELKTEMNSQKGSKDWSISEKWEKKDKIMFESKNKLQNAQEKMKLYEI